MSAAFKCDKCTQMITGFAFAGYMQESGEYNIWITIQRKDDHDANDFCERCTKDILKLFLDKQQGKT